MDQEIFSREDIEQIETHGMTSSQVLEQIKLFKTRIPYLKLLRPCTPGDGIKVLREEDFGAFLKLHEREALKGRFTKFVPASGAATRMFRALNRSLHQGEPVLKEDVRRQADEGDEDAQSVLRFIEGVRRFAFFHDLKSAVSRKGLNINALMESGDFTEVLRCLLCQEGLGYKELPKGLIKFHGYEDRNRTPFEEHLVEGASYTADQDKIVRLHFTVSKKDLEGFTSLLEEVRPYYEKEYGVYFRVSFSFQEKSTDTIAVDLENRPFRLENGRLLFRPGGHGALLQNLNNLKGNIVFIKNIDNVVPNRLKPTTYTWKKILAGYLISIQERVQDYLERVNSPGPLDEALLDEALTFVKDELSLSVQDGIFSSSPQVKKREIIEKLNRPIRVCGMVKNVKEPGGGPFWVLDHTGEVSRQIVETSQVDQNSPEQLEILSSSTHFNPVDLVCGVRDWQGRCFDLKDYVDPNTFFITRKSKEGRDIKALEHPGLWNGAMARWITLFVEVPRATFSPVKTVNDLLRKEHQTGNFEES